jgi:hypothetical protein
MYEKTLYSEVLVNLYVPSLGVIQMFFMENSNSVFRNETYSSMFEISHSLRHFLPRKQGLYSYVIKIHVKCSHNSEHGL